MPAIGAAERVVVAGPSAIAATIEAFAAATDLDWTEQVTVIATPPAHRQLAALGTALLNATKPTRFDAAKNPTKLILSADASPEDAARARELAG